MQTLFDTTSYTNSAKPTQYHIPLYTIKLVRDSSIKTHSKSIRNSDSLNDVARTLFSGLDREHLVVVMLDTKMNMIGVNTVFVGSLNTVAVSVREVFKPAIVSNANAIVLMHNHPSGDPTPSPDDISTTSLIKEAGKMLDIELLDHIIYGEDNNGERFLSMRATGLL